MREDVWSPSLLWRSTRFAQPLLMRPEGCCASPSRFCAASVYPEALGESEQRCATVAAASRDQRSPPRPPCDLVSEFLTRLAMCRWCAAKLHPSPPVPQPLGRARSAACAAVRTDRRRLTQRPVWAKFSARPYSGGSQTCRPASIFLLPASVCATAELVFLLTVVLRSGPPEEAHDRHHEESRLPFRRA